MCVAPAPAGTYTPLPPTPHHGGRGRRGCQCGGAREGGGGGAAAAGGGQGDGCGLRQRLLLGERATPGGGLGIQRAQAGPGAPAGAGIARRGGRQPPRKLGSRHPYGGTTVPHNAPRRGALTSPPTLPSHTRCHARRCRAPLARPPRWPPSRTLLRCPAGKSWVQLRRPPRRTCARYEKHCAAACLLSYACFVTFVACHNLWLLAPAAFSAQTHTYACMWLPPSWTCGRWGAGPALGA